MNSNKILQNYIEKLLLIREENRNRLPSTCELQEIAEDLGFSPEELSLVHQEFDIHIKNGQGFLELENWREAIREYEQALSIDPHHPEVLLNMAISYKRMWDMDLKYRHFEQAQLYARLSLRVKPGNRQALRILDELSRYESLQSWSWGCFAAIVMGGSFLCYLLLSA